MGTQAKIHCFNCNNDYLVYWSGINPKSPAPCPHCAAQMDDHMWECTIHAIGAIDDLNHHFTKYQKERDEHQFSVSVETILVPDEKFKFD